MKKRGKAKKRVIHLPTKKAIPPIAVDGNGKNPTEKTLPEAKMFAPPEKDVEIIQSKRKLLIKKGQRCPTTMQIERFCQEIRGEMLMLNRKGVFNKIENLCVDYLVRSSNVSHS
jgi:hypothetical protein